MRRIRFALLTLLVCAPLRAQLPTADAWREDVAVLRDALDTVHPGLHRYQTPVQLNEGFAQLEKQLVASRDLGEAYLALARFLSRIECGHTYPNPANQKRVVADAIFRNTPRLPFYFRWRDGRMIVTRDASRSGAFPVGTEVTAVNGVPTSAILEQLIPLSRADGANRPKRIANLEVVPEDRWDAFDVYFPHVFPPPAKEKWTFDVGGRSIEEVPATDAERLAIREELLHSAKDSNAPPWTLVVDGTKATLGMRTWVTYNDNWDWEAWLRHAFEQLQDKKVELLIIDLHGNEGGSSVGDVILAHLIRKPVQRDLFRRFVRYRSLPERLRAPLTTWDRSFDEWKDAKPSSARPGFFEVPTPGEELIQPRTPHFGGKVEVLVGPENSSATFEFALAMKRYKLGKLVGQPTGGNQRGINGGAFYFVRLPHSQLELDLPIIGLYADGNPPNGGIAPDVYVKPE
ncbi:MAG: S41 family peptidase [Acidobacteria bacterium]|nr:S41 family peptidase [Acidobacteriota bacterium]